MVYFVYYLIVLLLIFLIILLMMNKNIKNKEEQINNLKNQMKRQNEKNEKKSSLKINNRKNHRINIYNTTVELKILSSDDDRMQKVVGKRFTSTIKDLSQSGIRVLSSYSLPVKGQFNVQLYFTLSDTDFELKAKMIRKEEHLKEKLVTYGFQFFDKDHRTDQKLAFVLHNIEAERKNKNFIKS